MINLSLPYKEIAKLVNNKSKDNIGTFIQGESLLKLEQIRNLIEQITCNWNDVINNIIQIRIGRKCYIPIDREFINYVIKQRDLI